MKSMTGFGASHFRGKFQSIEINIKTVNGRYLDLRFHLPKEYAPLESQFKKILSKKIQRGTVDIYINRRQLDAGSHTELHVKNALGKKWLEAYQGLAKSLKLNTDVNLLSLVEMGELIQVEEDRSVSEAEGEKAFQVLKEAVSACDDERSREGEALKGDLVKLLDKLLSLVGQMGKLREKANLEIEQKVRKKLSQFELDKIEWEPRWALEVSSLVDRSDISEEIVRLREHISSFEKLLTTGIPVGKKLDFYCQELLREINTIGSKSQVAKLTHLVVDGKSVIEKLREQVQNVE